MSDNPQDTQASVPRPKQYTFLWKLIHEKYSLVAETLVLVVLLLVIAQTLIVDEGIELIFNIAVFSLTAFIGAFLIRIIRTERAEREESQKLTQYLRKANRELQNLDRLKSEFIYLATHQIRTPLTSIRGYISMILEGDYGEVPDHLRKPLDTVMASSTDMVDTVEYFLDVTRIERGKVDYDMIVFDMKDVVTSVADQMESVVEKAGLSFHVDIDDGEEYPVYADQGKIKQVVLNLVDNAVHYTKEGSITVHLWRFKGEVRVEVKDTGVGLSQADKDRIFQKFGRANNAEKRNVFGAGLGLYIAKQVLADHEGAIDAESEGRGEGSTFTITLPVANEQQTDNHSE